MRYLGVDFRPTPPELGRDWLNRGYGIRCCMCPRCAPPNKEENVASELDTSFSSPESATSGIGQPPAPTPELDLEVAVLASTATTEKT